MPNELLDKRNINRYKLWMLGHTDRFEDKSCADTDGDYLDGFYSPEKIIPDFLTHKEAARLRGLM